MTTKQADAIKSARAKIRQAIVAGYTHADRVEIAREFIARGEFPNGVECAAERRRINALARMTQAEREAECWQFLHTVRSLPGGCEVLERMTHD